MCRTRVSRSTTSTNALIRPFLERQRKMGIVKPLWRLETRNVQREQRAANKGEIPGQRRALLPGKMRAVSGCASTFMISAPLERYYLQATIQQARYVGQFS